MAASASLGTMMYLVGLVLFCTGALFQLVTLPVEFNASSRALKTLEGCAYLEGEENAQARKVLTAAALTYVAALFAAVVTLIRLILMANRRR